MVSACSNPSKGNTCPPGVANCSLSFPQDQAAARAQVRTHLFFSFSFLTYPSCLPQSLCTNSTPSFHSFQSGVSSPASHILSNMSLKLMKKNTYMLLCNVLWEPRALVDNVASSEFEFSFFKSVGI